MSKVIIWDQKEVIGPWVSSRIGVPWLGQEAIGIGKDGQILAGVFYEGFNGASIAIHVAAAPGTRWCIPAFLWTVFDYPFNQLQVRKVFGVVPSHNEAALRLDLHLGFVHEATLKDAHPAGDLLMLSMTRSQCRWLNFERKLHGKQQEGVACTGA